MKLSVVLAAAALSVGMWTAPASATVTSPLPLLTANQSPLVENAAFRGRPGFHHRWFWRHRWAGRPGWGWRHRWAWRHRGWGWGGVGFGVGVGLGYPYGYGGGYAGDHVQYCMSRYRSYDVRSDTFLGYDGIRHPCR